MHISLLLNLKHVIPNIFTVDLTATQCHNTVDSFHSISWL